MDKKLRKIVYDIINLEKECQAGNNIKENMEKMTKIMGSLEIEELLKVCDCLEKNLTE